MNQRRIAAIVVGALLATGLVGLSPAAGANAAAPARYAPKIDPRDFGGAVDNPWFPLVPGTRWTYAVKTAHGTEANTVEVTHETREILGVTSVVVHDVVRVGDRVTEETFDWYAQDNDGNVWYFGEDTKELDHGTVTSTEGSWEAGVNGAKAGIIMEARPGVGDVFVQEHATGVAEDQSQVLSLAGHASTGFGIFNNCVQTNEFSALEPGTSEQKLYAPGIGEVKEHSTGGELESLRLRSFTVGPAGFADSIDNPLLPILPGSLALYTGVKDGENETERVIVTNDTKQITGVTTTVVFDRVFINGVLAEKTYDFYAQDLAGNVWYFGEDSREIDNGKVVSREGSWEAGVNGAKPGIVMQAIPGVGNSYHQEDAAGVAQDQATVLALATHADVPFGTFNNCLETQEFSVLDPGSLEVKFYAAGIGLVKSQAISGEQEILRLVEFTA